MHSWMVAWRLSRSPCGCAMWQGRPIPFNVRDDLSTNGRGICRTLSVINTRNEGQDLEENNKACFPGPCGTSAHPRIVRSAGTFAVSSAVEREASDESLRTRIWKRVYITLRGQGRAGKGKKREGAREEKERFSQVNQIPNKNVPRPDG